MNENPFEWPEIPVESPKANRRYTSEVVPLAGNESLADDLVSWYEATLVPQLVCAPAAHPQKGWLLSPEPPRTAVLVRDLEGALQGVWIIKNNGIYYPCVSPDNVAGIFRALWDGTITAFDYVWASSANPVVMAFAQKAVRVPPAPSSPHWEGDKLVWRKGERDLGRGGV